jgi:hypothetical protein
MHEAAMHNRQFDVPEFSVFYQPTSTPDRITFRKLLLSFLSREDVENGLRDTI